MSFDITVDGQVYEALQRQAVPFVDTPNSVLRRLLGVEAEATASSVSPGSTRLSRRQAKGALPQDAFDQPILAAVVSLGGRARLQDVLDELDRRLGARLGGADREHLGVDGEVRWMNRARWARASLKERGLLASNSPRGVWEITDKGRAFLASASG